MHQNSLLNETPLITSPCKSSKPTALLLIAVTVRETNLDRNKKWQRKKQSIDAVFALHCSRRRPENLVLWQHSRFSCQSLQPRGSIPRISSAYNLLFHILTLLLHHIRTTGSSSFLCCFTLSSPTPLVLYFIFSRITKSPNYAANA